MTSGTSTRLTGREKTGGDRPKRRSVGGICFRIVRLGLVTYLLLLLVPMIFEESLIFFPSPYPQAIGSRRGCASRMPRSRRRTELGCMAGMHIKKMPARSYCFVTATPET